MTGLNQLSNNFTFLQLCHALMLMMTLSMESRVWTDLSGQVMTWKMMMWMMLMMLRICYDTWMSCVRDWTQFHPVESQRLDWKENPSSQVQSLKLWKNLGQLTNIEMDRNWVCQKSSAPEIGIKVLLTGLHPSPDLVSSITDEDNWITDGPRIFVKAL